jgi:putative protease
MFNNKIELLAPAGNLEKLKYAIDFGADAVYCGVPDFSLRVRINQFTESDLKQAADFAHKNDKKIFITLNIYAHNQHLKKVENHLNFLRSLKIDGVIVSDPGIINLVKKYLPRVDIHLSTQANATNWQAVKFWTDQGIKRIILAREVTLAEIKEIRKHNPDVELEYFVHGAMCMSYSGRCILSKWMANRSANLGDCAQPCRWLYKSTDKLYETSLIDDQQRFQVDLEEDLHGTYFFNSYDLNLIEHIKDLIDAGVTSFKIEGRAKSAYYLAIVVRAYRKVIDAVIKNTPGKTLKSIINEQKNELEGLVNRGYTKGFLLGNEPAHNFQNENRKGRYTFVGEVEDAQGKYNKVKIHNHLKIGDKIESITPTGNQQLKLKNIFDHQMKKVNEAHGGHSQRYFLELDRILKKGSLIRKR